MFGRRRNSPFQPLGLRLQRFGRRVMRNYAPTDEGPTRPASVPVPSAWQQSASEPLQWGPGDQQRNAPAPQQAAPAPQAPAPAPMPAAAEPAPVQRAPEPPAPPPGSVGDEANDRGLQAILAAHERRRAPAPSVARKLAEATTSTAKPDSASESGEGGEPIQTSRRRNRAAFDYVKTDALRADMTPAEIQQMQRQIAKPTVTPEPTPAPAPAEDISEGSFTEIADAGDIQRSADDSGTTEGSSADVTTADSSDDSGAPTDMLFAPPSDADAEEISPTLSPGIQRELDPNIQRMLDQAMTVTPSSGESAGEAETASQPAIQRQAAPRAMPSQMDAEPAPTIETARTDPQPNAPIQREAAPMQDMGESVTFTPAPQETRVPAPGTPSISRTANPSAVPNAADGTSVPSTPSDAPIQRDPAAEVQRLLDQAMTVTPSSAVNASTEASADSTASTPTAPIQRKAETTASTPTSGASTVSSQSAPSSAPVTPSTGSPVQRTVQRTADPSAPSFAETQADTPTEYTPITTASARPSASAEAPIQRTPDDSPTSSTASTNAPIQRTTADTQTSNTTSATSTDAPIQRELNPDVQRLLDQALTVTPSSAVNASTGASADSTTSAPIQRKRGDNAPAQSASTPTATSASAADTNASTPATPIQRTATSTPNQSASTAATPSTSASPSAAPVPSSTSTPIQRTPDTAASTPAASFAETQADPATDTTPITTASTRPSAVSDTPIQRMPADTPTSKVASNDAPIQRELNPDVQRLLDQAMTVTPSFAANAAPETPAASPSANTPNAPIQRQQAANTQSASTAADTASTPSTSTPIQRTADTTASASPANTPAATISTPETSAPANTPIQRSTETSAPANTPIQHSADAPQTPVSGSVDSVSFTPAPQSDAPIQRELNPDVQRLLDQALTVNPSSSASTATETPATSTDAAPSVQRTAATNAPVQRAAETHNQPTADVSSTAQPAIQRTPDAPVSGPIDSVAFTPAPAQSTAPIQRELNPDVQRLLDQALTVTPSSAVNASPETPAASTDAAPSVQRKAKTTNRVSRSSEQPASETPKPSIQAQSAQPQAAQPNASFSAPAASTGSQSPIQREVNADVQRLLDQALTVTPSSSAATPDVPTTSTPATSASSTPNTPIQRTAAPDSTPARSSVQRTADSPISGPIDSVSFTPAPQSDAPIQRELNPDVQRLLDQALTVTPSSAVNAAPETPAASTPSSTADTSATTGTPASTPRTASTGSVQRTPDTSNRSTAVQRTPDESAPVQPAASVETPVQRTLDPQVQRLLDQALTVTPSSSASAPAPETPTGPTTTSTSKAFAQRTPAKRAGRSIQGTPDDTTSPSAAPALSGNFQQPLDPQVQRMLDQAMSVTPSASASETAQTDASVTPGQPNIQRQAAPQQPGQGTVGVSPSLQGDPFNRKLSPDIQRRLEEAMRVTPSSSDRSGPTPLPVESRRPFIPTNPSEVASSAPTANPNSVQRSAATPPSTPSQPGTSTPATPAASNASAQPSGGLEADLLRWMGLPPDTPVEGRLSRKQSDDVSALMRKAETSTAKPSEPARPTSETPESDTAASQAASPSQTFGGMPSISDMISREVDNVQRAVTVDEVSTSMGGDNANNQSAEEAIDTIAHRVLDMIRTRLRLERERNRKF